MAFRLRESALPPPTSCLGPFREIQRGWQQLGESCKARRRLPQKQDVGLESTDMFALLQTEAGLHSLAALSSAADSAGSLDVVGQCGKLSWQQRRQRRRWIGQGSGGKRLTGVFADAGGLIERKWSLYKVYGTAAVLSELYLAVLNDLFRQLQSG